jgi:uncharacterized protein YkwD
MRPLRTLVATVALAAAPAGPPAAAAGPPAAPPAAADARAIGELVAALNRERASLGLGPLRPDPALAAAAQAHADDMAARGYFAVAAPEGTTIDDRVAGAGYPAALVAAKLVGSPPLVAPAEIAAGWRAQPEAGRDSVFHPEVAEVGAGLASGDGRLLWAIVLARRDDSAERLAAREAALGDLAATRAAFLAAVNDARRAAGLARLRADATLDRAAQTHAEALLAARRSGLGETNVAPLAQRVQEERAGRAGSPGVVGGSHQWRSRSTGTRTGSRLREVGESVVVDAADAASAVATALAGEASSDLREASYARLGVGVAFARDGDEWRAVWVACLTRL